MKVLLKRKGRLLAQRLLSILNKTACNKKSHTGSLVTHHTRGSRVRHRGIIVTPPSWFFPKIRSFVSGLSTLHHCQRADIQGQGSSEWQTLCSVPFLRSGEMQIITSLLRFPYQVLQNMPTETEIKSSDDCFFLPNLHLASNIPGVI